MGVFSKVGNAAGAAVATVANTAHSAASVVNGLATAGGAIAGQQMLGSTVNMAMNGAANTTEATLEQANDIQNRLAMVSATMQVAALARSMMMQALRDMIKDAKDTVKDQGEAGHKP